MKIELFFLAAFRAHVILGLACLSSVVLRTGPHLIPTLCAARWLSLHWIIGATKAKQHPNSDCYDSHNGVPPNAPDESP
jgi:hypothetical protein